MEVSSLSNGSAALGARPQATAAVTRPAGSTGSEPSAAPQSSFVEDCIECREGRAAEVFRSEISRAVEAELKVKLRSGESTYPGTPDSGLDGVVPDVLRTTKRVAEANPDVSTRVVARVRQSIQTAAQLASATVARGDATKDIDDDVGRLEDGLKAVDEFAARQVESSASVLSIETRIRQRSAIRIRTQEGDIVQLMVGFGQRLSAQSSSVQGDGFGIKQTEVAVAERSRLSLRVKGDLNDAELSAIRLVFAQAERIADEFFAGDLSAALGSAAALEYDSGQLAAVSLRLRSRSVTNVAYAEATVREPMAAPVIAAEPAVAETADSTPEIDAVESTAAVPADEVSTDVIAENAADAEAVADPVGRFFDLLSDFLKGVSEGFRGGHDRAYTFHYSQSFKLQILRSVFELMSQDSAENDSSAGKLIDAAAMADGENSADD